MEPTVNLIRVQCYNLKYRYPWLVSLLIFSPVHNQRSSSLGLYINISITKYFKNNFKLFFVIFHALFDCAMMYNDQQTVENIFDENGQETLNNFRIVFKNGVIVVRR